MKLSQLIEHYLNYHHINSKNWFFQKLCQSDNRPFLKNCLRCKQFITTREQKTKHHFLKHYNEGKEIPFEEEPLDIIKYPALTIIKSNIRNILISIRLIILRNVLMIFYKM